MEKLMAVRRIVANIAADKVEAAASFCRDILDMNVAIDHGWIVTFATDAATTPRTSPSSTVRWPSPGA